MMIAFFDRVTIADMIKEYEQHADSILTFVPAAFINRKDVPPGTEMRIWCHEIAEKRKWFVLWPDNRGAIADEMDKPLFGTWLLDGTVFSADDGQVFNSVGKRLSEDFSQHLASSESVRESAAS